MGQDVDAEQVEAGLLADARAGGEQDFAPVPAERFADRIRREFFAVLKPGEEGTLQNAQANQQAKHDKKAAQEERHAPAELDECIPWPDALTRRHHRRGRKKSERDTRLRPTAIEAALALMSGFHGQQDGAAPFATDADPLQNAQESQDQGRG